MPEDRVIKSGQFTLSRLFFLALCGAAVFIIVATGRLNIGYHLLTLVLCGLLILIALDWGVKMEEVQTRQMTVRPDLNPSPALATPSSDPASTQSAARDPRVKRRPARQPKRRR